jgi:hypothetical protein
LSRAQQRILGEKLSGMADQTPRELLKGSGRLTNLRDVPGGSDVDSSLRELARRAIQEKDDVAIRTLKEVKKAVPELGL